jgi:hypothetical protein
MPSHPPAPQPFPWSKLALGAVVLLTLVLVDQRLRFTAQNIANVFFSDQWDIYNPLFNGEGWWKIFSYQHGPHRQGLGFVFTAGLAHLTHWDARGDALLTVGVTGLAALLALPLARKCGARTGLALATVPVIFLTLRQFEAWVGAANPSHGAFPLLLLVLYGFTWFIPRPLWRLGLQVLLTFFLVFTGFGLFAGVLSPALLALETWRAFRQDDRRLASLTGAAGLLTVAVWILFFHGYTSQPAVPNFRFPYERPWEYGCFSAIMLASYAGLQGRPGLDLAAGFVLLFLVGGVAAWHGLRLLRSAPSAQPAHAVIFTLSAFTLLYCLGTSVGRVMLGWQDAAYAPRYVTLVIPGIFALYLHGENLAARRWRNGCWAALLLLAVWSGISLSPNDRNAVEWYRRGRETWRETYLATGSQAKTDATTSSDAGYTVHPGDLTAKLEFLRQHRLNLFKPAPFTR